MLSPLTRNAASPSTCVPKLARRGSRTCPHHKACATKNLDCRVLSPVVIAWLPAVTYSAKNHDSGICRVCPNNYFSTLLVSRITRFFAIQRPFCKFMGVWNHGAYAMMKTRRTWWNHPPRPRNNDPHRSHPFFNLFSKSCLLQSEITADNTIMCVTRRSLRHTSLCVHFENLRDQVICWCACHAILATKICGLSFLSKIMVCSLCNGNSEVWASIRECIHYAKVLLTLLNRATTCLMFSSFIHFGSF